MSATAIYYETGLVSIEINRDESLKLATGKAWKLSRNQPSQQQLDVTQADVRHTSVCRSSR